MSYELIDNWADYRLALDRLLNLAAESLCIYDEDLAALHLDSADHQIDLKRCLHGRHQNALRIAVRNARILRERSPALQDLLRTYGHIASARETPPHLAHLRDSMILADGRHALIRFERDLPRSKLLIDEPEQILPYQRRFDEIWQEGGEMITSTPLGL